MQVLCDTSFLMVLVSKPIKNVERVEHELGVLEFTVPDMVIEELKRLEAKAGPKRSTLARTALALAQTRFKAVQVPRAVHVDDSIVEYATEKKCAVATIDTNLRRRLIRNEVLVITLSRDRLTIANPSIGA
jgi:rRNA-processing protein FCF1